MIHFMCQAVSFENECSVVLGRLELMLRCFDGVGMYNVRLSCRRKCLDQITNIYEYCNANRQERLTPLVIHCILAEVWVKWGTQ